MARREATQPKKSMGRAIIKKGIHGSKTHEQKQLAQQKNLSDYGRFYGVMVSNLDAESKDSS